MANAYPKRAPIKKPVVAEPAQEYEYQHEQLVVVEDESKFDASRARGHVCIESLNKDFPRAIEELGSTDSRNLALNYAAAQGVGDARLNGNIIGPYAINEDGLPLDRVADDKGEALPPTHKKMQPKAYRCEVPVCRRLV